MRGSQRGQRIGGAAVVSAAFVIGVLWGSSHGASGEQAPVRIFDAPTGLVFNYVKPDQGPTFESTMTSVSEILATSEDLDRRQQGVGWKLYRVEEPLDNGVLLYISVLSPVVLSADYWVPEIFNEAFPTEVQELYDTYVETFADGQILMNLHPVALVETLPSEEAP